jgi:hypothetical protein
VFAAKLMTIIKVLVTGIVARSVAAKLMTIISFCRFPSLSNKLARSKKFILAEPDIK